MWILFCLFSKQPGVWAFPLGLCCLAGVHNARSALCIWGTHVQTLISLCLRQAAGGLGSRNLEQAERQPPLFPLGGTSVACFSLQDTAFYATRPLFQSPIFAFICCTPTLQLHSFLKRFSFYRSLGRLLPSGSPGASPGLRPGSSASY